MVLSVRNIPVPPKYAPAQSASNGLLERLFRLHRQADRDFRRAIEHLEHLIAQQAAELAFAAVAARQFDPPIAGAAIRADDIGFLHGANMGSARFDFDSVALSQSNDRSDTTMRRE
jgi:hypothetical protein